MLPSSSLGFSLAALRHLRGLSLEECAAAARLAPSAVEAVEAGEGDSETIRTLTALFGLSDVEDEDGEFVKPREGSTFTVFLLHSATTAFDARDLPRFEEAIRAARIYTALSPQAGERYGHRRVFTAVPPAGSLRRDAARQGHALARSVRRQLGNDEAPLDDLRSLLEEHYGIPVLVRSLRTEDLRAAAALDADRACAAVLLSDQDAPRALNPLLARVYLAHELCHLLFDPSRPGRVQLALDDRLGGPSAGPHARLESRARGFAAELLLPERGLLRLFGGEPIPDTVDGTGERVLRAAQHFRTPGEIALHHLGNLGLLRRDLKDRVSLGYAGVDQTTLPIEGALPRCLETLPHALTSWRSAEARPKRVPAFVEAARGRVRSALLSEIDELLASVQSEIAAGRVLEATDRLVAWVDDLVLGDELERAALTLDRIDVTVLPPEVSTTLAALTAHAQHTLGASWSEYVARLFPALQSRWGFSEARCERLRGRLRSRRGD